MTTNNDDAAQESVPTNSLIRDREAWLINDIAFMTRTKIDTSQYVELRDLAVRLLNLLVRSDIANAEVKAPRMFPIQQGSPIPWPLAERAYNTYARLFGTSQSLERLAQSGGFGVEEFACYFLGHDPRHKGTEKCVEQTDAYAQFISKIKVEMSQGRTRIAELEREIASLKAAGIDRARECPDCETVPPDGSGYCPKCDTFTMSSDFSLRWVRRSEVIDIVKAKRDEWNETVERTDHVAGSARYSKAHVLKASAADEIIAALEKEGK